MNQKEELPIILGRHGSDGQRCCHRHRSPTSTPKSRPCFSCLMNFNAKSPSSKQICECKSNVWLSPLQVFGCIRKSNELAISYQGPGPAQPILRTVNKSQDQVHEISLTPNSGVHPLHSNPHPTVICSHQAWSLTL